MTKVTVDESLRSKLNTFTEHVELCDASGRTIGHFLPEEVYRKLLYSSVEIPLSEEEMERRRREKGGRSLAEIWKSLGRT